LSFILSFITVCFFSELTGRVTFVWRYRIEGDLNKYHPPTDEVRNSSGCGEWRAEAPAVLEQGRVKDVKSEKEGR